MTFRTLIRRSLRFHWRSHLGVVLGAAIGSAALIGALVVGDSVRKSLQERVLERLGPVHYALAPSDRFFRDDLGYRFKLAEGDGLQKANIFGSNSVVTFEQMQPVTALELNGTASKANGGGRANHVTIYGVSLYLKGIDDGKWLGDLAEIQPGEVWINEALAAQIRAAVGDDILLRTAKSRGVASEVALSPRSSEAKVIRLKVSRIVAADSLGSFSLHASSQPVHNAFVKLTEVQRHLDWEDGANLLLLSEAHLETDKMPVLFRIEDWLDRQFSFSPDWLSTLVARLSPNVDEPKATRAPSNLALPVAKQLLESGWVLDDAQGKLRNVMDAGDLELVSRRILLDPPIIRASLAAASNAQPILTYLATLLRAGTNATPYSMVTAAGWPWAPTEMRTDEILVSQWLADDLHVKPGDEIAMSYFLPESGAKLEETTNTFRVRAIVPMEMPWADRTLMPDFPGIEKAESTSEWDAGFPLTYKVRPKDDEYWKQHRGTPKAFITLAAGQKMWSNRFGNLTAIRFSIPTNASPEAYRAELEKKILANLKPEELGLRFEPVREQALKAAAESQDFGGLFLGFSFFLIIAALLLMAMLFQFGLEQRAPEIGTLLALGFTPGQVRKLLLREGVALAFIGGVIGTIGGLLYAKAMLHGLTTIWRDAVGASALSFHFTGQTLVIGLLASVVVSAVTIWLALRKFVKRPARELLVGEINTEQSKVQSLKAKVIGAGALLATLGLVGFAVVKGDTSNAGIFFGAGALVLVAGLSFGSDLLTRLSGAPVSDPARPAPALHHAGPEAGAPITFGSLAVRGCARRWKRSLSTMAMLACGSFLIVSIGVFRLDANRDAAKRTSGTGGFALIGETTLSVVQDLNSQSGREFFALNERDLAGVSFVPFRVREGDEASCLNLNAAQKPRLLGVKPEMLGGRFAFAKSLNEMTKIGPWSGLERFHLSVPLDKDEIPAIGDANSIQWAIHKKVGDTVDYVDERGQPFKVRIVGAVANSILQGQLIIDEAEFVKRFPGESGYRTFLIDAPSNAVSQVSASLSRAMQDVGLELTPAPQRLAQFNAVQNTYLGTFQILGGLGLLLGSVGLGIVVLRNVLERRGELALLMAVGFRKAQVQRLLLMENAALLTAGLVLGVVAAAVAVLPALLSPGAQLPVASLALTLGAVLVNGAAWTWAATKLAVRGDLLAALRNE